jgi:hypothetical protein
MNVIPNKQTEIGWLKDGFRRWLSLYCYKPPGSVNNCVVVTIIMLSARLSTDNLRAVKLENMQETQNKSHYSTKYFDKRLTCDDSTGLICFKETQITLLHRKIHRHDSLIKCREEY